MNLTNEELLIMQRVAEATQQGRFAFEQLPTLTNLLSAGLVECNMQQVDAAGAVATRATMTGVAFVYPAPPPAPVAPQAPAATHATAQGYQIGTGFVPPTKNIRRSAKRSKYPFDALEPGGYFFVAATEAKPDPAKSLGSTVTSANKRYRDCQPRRYFKVYPAVKGQVFGNVVAESDGAYVVREVNPPAYEPKPVAAVVPAA